MKFLAKLREKMRSRAIESEKRNMFGIIKDIFGNFGSAIKEIVNTEIDESSEEKDPVVDSQMQNIKNTRFSDDDVVEIIAGSKARFSGISEYRTNGNVEEAVKLNKARSKATKGIEADRARDERV